LRAARARRGAFDFARAFAALPCEATGFTFAAGFTFAG
jgi:hypothetical protein